MKWTFRLENEFTSNQTVVQPNSIHYAVLSLEWHQIEYIYLLNCYLKWFSLFFFLLSRQIWIGFTASSLFSFGTQQCKLIEIVIWIKLIKMDDFTTAYSVCNQKWKVFFLLFFIFFISWMHQRENVVMKSDYSTIIKCNIIL